MTTWICLYIIGVCLSMIHVLRVSARKKHYLVYPEPAILLVSFVWALGFPIVYPSIFLISICVYLYLKRGATK